VEDDEVADLDLASVSAHAVVDEEISEMPLTCMILLSKSPAILFGIAYRHVSLIISDQFHGTSD
jgi:hypothetical protein